MPQKLIRLTSETGDGIFNGIFNQEIVIKENSSIALQSLSVERLSKTLNINGDNNLVNVSSNGVDFEAGRILPFGEFNKGNQQELFDNIGVAMNSKANAFITPHPEYTWGLQHGVTSANEISGVVEVISRISPFYQIQIFDSIDISPEGMMSFVDPNAGFRENGPGIGDNVAVWQKFEDDASGFAERGMFRDSNTSSGGGTGPNINEAYVYGNQAITKSTGAFRVRLKKLVDRGGVPSFTMGLVKGDAGLIKLQQGSVTLADLEYAIRVNGPTTQMQVKRQLGGDFATTVSPVNYTYSVPGKSQLGDVLDIRVASGTIRGHISSQVNVEESAYYDLENGGQNYVQFNPTANVTFSSSALDLGPIAKFKTTTDQAGLDGQWYAPKPGSTTEWYRYFSAPQTDRDFRSGEAVVGVDGVISVGTSTQTLTPPVLGELNVIPAVPAAAPVVTSLGNMINYEPEEDYYWAIFMHEGVDNCVLDLVGVTLDPIGKNGDFLETATLPGNAFNQSLTTGYSVIDDLPVQENAQMGYDEPNFTKAYVQFGQASDDRIVSSYLGFNDNFLFGPYVPPSVGMFPFNQNGQQSTEYAQDIGYEFTADQVDDNEDDADNYIVDTQTFTLDSFDSFGLSALERSANSGGSRRNIIATIPITEVSIPGSTNSIIQFQPATLNYIAIKNRGDMVTRQIRCRLLSGRYKPVKTEGLASLVLLIEE